MHPSSHSAHTHAAGVRLVGTCTEPTAATAEHSEPCVFSQELETQLSWTQKQVRDGASGEGLEDRWKSHAEAHAQDVSSTEAHLQKLNHLAAQVGEFLESSTVKAQFAALHVLPGNPRDYAEGRVHTQSTYVTATAMCDARWCAHANCMAGEDSPCCLDRPLRWLPRWPGFGFAVAPSVGPSLRRGFPYHRYERRQ